MGMTGRWWGFNDTLVQTERDDSGVYVSCVKTRPF